MKDAMENRVKRIEEILRKEYQICMVALRDENGLHWNGKTYLDEDALQDALMQVEKDYDLGNKPLVIITKTRFFENKPQSLN